MARPVPTPFHRPRQPAGSAMMTLISLKNPPSTPVPTSFLLSSLAPSRACSPNAAIPFPPTSGDRRIRSASSCVTISPQIPAHLEGCRQPSGAGGTKVAPDAWIIPACIPGRPIVAEKEGIKEGRAVDEGMVAPRQVALAVLRGADDVGAIRCRNEFGPGPAWAEPSLVGRTAV